MSLDPAGHGGKAGRYAKLRDQAVLLAVVLEALTATPAADGAQRAH